MDFWDRKKVKKLGSAQAHMTSHFEWSPDSQYLLTGILFPRMRIDNDFKVWNFDGTLIHRQQFTGSELYQINWQPIPSSLLPEYLISPNTLPKPTVKPLEITEPPKPAKYVHPNSSGRASSAKVEEGPVKYSRQQPVKVQKPKQELPPGYDPEEDSKGKRKKKKPAQKGKTETPVTTKTEIQIEEPDFGQAPSSPVDTQKKLKIISKKLRQIDDLKLQQQNGKVLGKEQLDKLASEESLREELDGLSL